MTTIVSYKPLLPVLCRLHPQEAVTELVTVLQDVYQLTITGGQNSRKKVVELLLKLGLQPNG